MKIHTITKIVAAAMLAFAMSGCDDGGDIPDVCGVCNDDTIIDNEEGALDGTSWKLVGVVDETGSLRELEPTDCDRCYTLTFATELSPLQEFNFRTFSISNTGYGVYDIDYNVRNIGFSIEATTLVGFIGAEEQLEQSWFNTFSKIESFSFQENELRLYYDENYLLFERVFVAPPEPPFDLSLQPESLAGTAWRLTNVSIDKSFEIFERIDISGENIIYEFQENDRLIISGNTDYLLMFDSLGISISDNFRDGEHVYTYTKPMNACPTCSPWQNMTINNTPNDYGLVQNIFAYYSIVRSDNEVMKISGGGPLGWDGKRENYYFWEKTFIIIR